MLLSHNRNQILVKCPDLLSCLTFDSTPGKHLATLQKARERIHRRLELVRHELDLETIKGILGLADILFANRQTSAVRTNNCSVLQRRFQNGGRHGFGRPVSLVSIRKLRLFISELLSSWATKARMSKLKDYWEAPPTRRIIELGTYMHCRSVLAGFAKDNCTTAQLL